MLSHAEICKKRGLIFPVSFENDAYFCQALSAEKTWSRFLLGKNPLFLQMYHDFAYFCWALSAEET